ncbi:MAG: ferrous iron transport protein A [Anaerolineae bacterium]|nr:ferrous iron transport protein A [Anaerolineae bacterium]
MSLAELAPGEWGTVVDLRGGPGFVGRLAALGFTPGATVRMVRNPGFGPLIVEILDTQIALGRGQALRVYVRRRR